jgi:hypothetical protein
MPWKGEGKGRTAKAPPPDEFQLTLMYRYRKSITVDFPQLKIVLTPEVEMRLVSHALLVTLTFSILCSFFADCPNTCL